MSATATSDYLNHAPRTEAEVRRPKFHIGDVWTYREPMFGDRRDRETIIAITTHPETPIVTQCPMGCVSAYRADGRQVEGEDCKYDLVTLVQSKAPEVVAA